MKNKIVGILVMTLLISTTASSMNLPITKYNEYDEIESSNLAQNSLAPYIYTLKTEPENDTFVSCWIDESSNHIGSYGNNEGRYPTKLIIANDFMPDYLFLANILIKFPIQKIPVGATITKAYFTLKQDYNCVPWKYLDNLEAQIILENWKDTTVEWNSAPASQPTGIFNYDENEEEYFWDITDIVKDWYTGVIPNFGLKIIMPKDIDEQICFFAFNTSEEPLLFVEYSGGGPPPEYVPPQLPDCYDDDNLNPEITDPTIDPPNPEFPQPVNVEIKTHDNCAIRLISYTIARQGKELITKNWQPNEGEFLTDKTLLIPSIDCQWGNNYIDIYAEDFKGQKTSLKRIKIEIGDYIAPECEIKSHDYPTEIWPYDNSEIELEWEASDDNGIKEIVIGISNGFWDPEGYPDFGKRIPINPPQKSANGLWSFNNIDIPSYIPPFHQATSDLLVCVQATDVTGVKSDIEYYYIPVKTPYQWRYGLPFHNPSDVSKPWEFMEDIYGEDGLIIEIPWWVLLPIPHEFRNPIAVLFYDYWAKNCLLDGSCMGCSMYSLIFSHYREEVPDDLDFAGVDHFMNPLDGNRFFDYRNGVNRSIERFQGTQISKEHLKVILDDFYIKEYKAFEKGNDPYPDFITDTIPQIQFDVEYGIQGYISVSEGFGLNPYQIRGHVVVPWAVKDMGNGEYRIYVYDPNREDASYFDPDTLSYNGKNYYDYEDYELYPFITISESDMKFTFDNGKIWAGFIAYGSYGKVMCDDYNFFSVKDGLGWVIDIFLK